MALSTMLDIHWMLVALAVVMLFLGLQAIYYRQIWAWRIPRRRAWKGSGGRRNTIAFPVALLIRGSVVVMWAAPFPDIIGFVVTYACLSRRGSFYQPGEREVEPSPDRRP